jgi:hypothetical protein
MNVDHHRGRTRLGFVSSLLAICALAGASSYAVSGAGFTTVNEAVDGPDHCENGNPQVNCNLYDGKEFVWLNGGPAANGLGPDGQYFFAVLEPGGQPSPNDGGAKNLSDDFDAYTNRTFTVTGGEVSAYAGTHDNQVPFIRLFPYADTTNPGGVYIMAICSLGTGYPVNPRDCKYDAFKVKEGVANVNAHLSGRKYDDSLPTNGQLDPGEAGLEGWQINISCSDGTGGSTQTGIDGTWSFATTLHPPEAGTTDCEVSEVQKAGYVQSGNAVDQSTSSGGATVQLTNEMTYVVTIPRNAASSADGLHFGNHVDTGGND